MKKYTRATLEKAGYEIKNAKITSVSLNMENHGCSVCGGGAVCVEKDTQATYILTPCCPACGAEMEVK